MALPDYITLAKMGEPNFWTELSTDIGCKFRFAEMPQCGRGDEVAPERLQIEDFRNNMESRDIQTEVPFESKDPLNNIR